MRRLRGDFDDEFREFVVGAQARVLRFAELLVGDRGVAEDLAQHGFAKAYAAWPTLRVGSPEQYVRRCVRNASTDRWRRGGWRETATASLPERADVDPHAATLERDMVLRALSTLDAVERSVIVLRYYNDLPETEIAAELGIPAGTVKSTASRALRKLRASVDAVPAPAADQTQGAKP